MISTVVWWFLNLVSSIALIQINKYIYKQYGFPNMTLTCLHFLITFICLFICNLLGLVKIVNVPLRKMIPMSLSFCGFVVLTNFSLQYNTVGTYQCYKALTAPGVLMISYYFYNKQYSWQVTSTLVSKIKPSI
jgi:solute carrier family 35 protein E3